MKTRGYIFGIWIFALILTVSLCGCGKAQSGKGTAATTVTTTVTTEETTAGTTVQAYPFVGYVNATTLKKKFKERYGDSLAAHIHHHRMERAAELLVSTDASIGEIAAQVGFQGQSRLTSAFQARFGVTPSNYRRRAKGKRQREEKNGEKIGKAT